MSQRYALVTGASSGIGAAIAVELGVRGWSVGCVSRRGVKPIVPRGARPLSGSLTPLPCDVTDPEQVRATVDGFLSKSGQLHGLVNAAGLHQEADSTAVRLDELMATFATNFFGALRMCQCAFPYLAKASGQIVNVGSFYARLGVPRNLGYSASKAALASLTRTLAVEWASSGISVVTVAPGYVRTAVNEEFLSSPANTARLERRIPLHRIAAPAEIARVVGALMDSSAPFLTGEVIYIDGAQGITL
jgi:NAD(P)-dependent dehydrogenase (short-subunit alcohol dehydrogenase family)